MDKVTAAIKQPERRGFASMTPERRREIASRAGRAAHANGNAHKWTPETAAAAGRIGGRISRRPDSKKIMHPDLSQ